MENNNFCQSCSMPLDANVSGTEKDGSPNHEYCKYCYRSGAFTSPGMTIEEMKVVVKTEMGKQAIPPAIIEQAVTMLPYLKRWKV